MKKYPKSYSDHLSMLRLDLQLFGMTCFTLCFISCPAFAGNDLTSSRQSELIHLLKNDCGSCHGMTLKGGLGPALLPKNMSGKSTEGLQTIILDGIPDTPMPPWRGQLSETDATFLVHLLQHGLTHE